VTELARLPWTEEQRLLAAVDTAARYYRDNLFADNGAGPRAYLTDRGVEHVLDHGSVWQVGYAPAGWTNLVQHLRAARFDDEESIAAGLITRCRRGTLIDRFRDRVVVPIRDHLDGNVIAFTARAAPGAGPAVPKYLNTPTTALYRKSDELLGLHEHRQALLAGVSPVLVEGAFDVLGMAAAAAGDLLVPVSPCGTRVTSYQFAELVVAATSRRLVIAFDNDPAGRAASERTLGLARTAAPGFRLSTVLLADGLDPAMAASLSGARVVPHSPRSPRCSPHGSHAEWPVMPNAGR